MASIYHTIPYHTIITLPPPINLRQKPTLTHTLPHHSIVTSVAPRSLSFLYILSIFRKLPSIHSLSSSFRILLSVLVPLQGLPLSVYYVPCPQVRLPSQTSSEAQTPAYDIHTQKTPHRVRNTHPSSQWTGWLGCTRIGFGHHTLNSAVTSIAHQPKTRILYLSPPNPNPNLTALITR